MNKFIAWIKSEYNEFKKSISESITYIKEYFVERKRKKAANKIRKQQIKLAKANGTYVKEKKHIWRKFFKLFVYVKIPWWLYILIFLGSFALIEVNQALVQFTVSFNKGDLYNSVLLKYAGWQVIYAFVLISNSLFSLFATAIVTKRFQKVVWKKTINLPISTFDKEQPSSLVSRVTNDTGQISGVPEKIPYSFASLYGILGAFVALFRINTTLATFYLISVPFSILLIFVVGKMQYSMNKRTQVTLGTMTEYFAEHLNSVKHFKTQATEEKEVETGLKAINRRYHADLFAGIMGNIQVACGSLYTKTMQIILYLFGAREINAGNLVSSGLVEFEAQASLEQKYMFELVMYWQGTKGPQGATEKLANIMEYQDEVLEREQDMPEANDLVFNNVSFGYSDNNEVLKGLTFTIPKGKKTAIIGDNGSGKSTLFKLIMRFYEPTKGTISFGNNIEVDTIHLDSWREKFGYVLQSNPLFAGTIRENITYGCKEEVSDEELINAAKIANAYDFIMELPDGFDTDIGENGSKLSGGQRQRIAIARAVITNPEYLLMDEATASLDYKADQLIREACEKLMKNRTTIMIAHDLKSVIDSDQIIVLNNGSLEACGTPEEVLEISPTYQKYYQLQKLGS
jgi:ABC-type multidrug transport system fused ATPase/permease subunit